MNQRSNRRTVLRAALAASVGVLWGPWRAEAREGGKTILVVGAGMAGLAAARELRALGHAVVVIEGRERVGGRVWTQRSLGMPVDVGASWIHGVTGNPISALAAEAGIATRATDFDSRRLHDHDGKALGDEAQARVGAALDGLLAEVDALAERRDADISVREAIRLAIGGEELDAFEARALDWRMATLETDAGADLEDLSLAGQAALEGYAGGDRLFPGGYDGIIEHVARGTDVRLGQRVRRITHGDAGAVVTTDKEEFRGDAVICTLPLGVLRAGAVTFEPGLPGAKVDAIGRLKMGVVNKLALAFPKAFWPVDKHLLGYMSKTHGEFPVFLNLAQHAGKPLLVGFVAGTPARAGESLSDEAHVGRAMEILGSMYGDIPDPTGFLRTKWSSDPFSRGSYSHIPMGGSLADSRALAAPVGERLFFAGEATAAGYAATVHGAFLSGVREARRIGKA